MTDDADVSPVDELMNANNRRRHRMDKSFGFIPIVMAYQPVYTFGQNLFGNYPDYRIPSPYDDDIDETMALGNGVSDDNDDSAANDDNQDADDDMSRGNRRRHASYDSPIYYIRVPPTPYMFVPGVGYISQPPTILPPAMRPYTPQYTPPQYTSPQYTGPQYTSPQYTSPQYTSPHYSAPQYSTPQYSSPPYQALAAIPAPSPFINLPIPFISNGKPTGVYQWNAGASFGAPQFPQYLPSRPQRPSYKPKPSYRPDSKITHLTGMFNGRPEDIYLLQQGSPFNAPPMYTHPISRYY